MTKPVDKGKAPAANPTTEPTTVYIDDWSLEAKNRPLETNFMSTDDFWPRSRESLNSIRHEEVAHPMPDVFERMSRCSFSAQEVKDEIQNRIDYFNAQKVQHDDVDTPLLGPEPLDKSWVKNRNDEYIAEALQLLIAQRDAALTMAGHLRRIANLQAQAHGVTLARVREFESVGTPLEGDDTTRKRTTAGEEPDLTAVEVQIGALCEERDTLQEKVNRLQGRLIDALEANVALRSAPRPRRSETPGLDPDDPLASTESAPAARVARTAKIADPEKFTDGISPKYSVWKSALLRKFAGNADLFPTEATKLGYAASHIGGQAMEALDPHLEDGSPEQIVDVEGLLDFLDQYYTDPTELQRAQDEFLDLSMGSSTFREFCTAFVQTAIKAQVPKTTWKREFNRRLNRRLQNGLTRDYIDASVGFEAFQRLGHQFALQYSVIDKVHKPASSKNDKGGASGSSLSGTGTGGGTARSSTPRARSGTPVAKDLDKKERDELKDAGKCFYCKEEGHIRTHCPKLLAAAIRKMQTLQPQSKPAASDKAPTEDSEN
jgi:hypothetical protein